MDSVVHFEIPADDLERAKKFYADNFGWAITAVPEMEYNMVRTGQKEKQDPTTAQFGFINGGMMKRMKAVQSPVVTINVSDIDAAAKKIEASGGKIVVGKQPVGDMGFTIYFQDSEGNVLGLWQSTPKK